MISTREQAKRQGNFYNRAYHKLLNALILSCIIILLLIGGIAYIIIFEPGIKYYGTSLGGKIIPMAIRK